MKYRRYYTKRHPNGSRTVVSVGPVGMLAGGYAKLFAMWFLAILVVIVLVWPILLVNGLSHDSHAWTYGLGIPLEVVWLIVVAAGWAAHRESKKEPSQPTPPRNTRR
jgi:hypothetical protein